MYAAIASMDGTASAMLAAIFVLGWLFISKIILFDLFIVMVMQYFSVADTIRMINAPGRVGSLGSSIQSAYVKFFTALCKSRCNRVFSYNTSGYAAGTFDTHQLHNTARGMCTMISHDHVCQSSECLITASVHKAATPQCASVLRHLVQQAAPFLQTGTTEQNDSPHSESNVECDSGLLMFRTHLSIEMKRQDMGRQDRPGNSALARRLWRSFLSFGHDNLVHRICLRIQQNAMFSGFMYSCIFFSCLLLISTPPAPDVPGQNTLFTQGFLETGNYVFTVVFTVEMFVHICAQVMVQ